MGCNNSKQIPTIQNDYDDESSSSQPEPNNTTTTNTTIAPTDLGNTTTLPNTTALENTSVLETTGVDLVTTDTGTQSPPRGVLASHLIGAFHQNKVPLLNEQGNVRCKKMIATLQELVKAQQVYADTIERIVTAPTSHCSVLLPKGDVSNVGTLAFSWNTCLAQYQQMAAKYQHNGVQSNTIIQSFDNWRHEEKTNKNILLKQYQTYRSELDKTKQAVEASQKKWLKSCVKAEEAIAKRNKKAGTADATTVAKLKQHCQNTLDTVVKDRKEYEVSCNAFNKQQKDFFNLTKALLNALQDKEEQRIDTVKDTMARFFACNIETFVVEHQRHMNNITTQVGQISKTAQNNATGLAFGEEEKRGSRSAKGEEKDRGGEGDAGSDDERGEDEKDEDEEEDEDEDEDGEDYAEHMRVWCPYDYCAPMATTGESLLGALRAHANTVQNLDMLVEAADHGGRGSGGGGTGSQTSGVGGGNGGETKDGGAEEIHQRWMNRMSGEVRSTDQGKKEQKDTRSDGARLSSTEVEIQETSGSKGKSGSSTKKKKRKPPPMIKKPSVGAAMTLVQSDGNGAGLSILRKMSEEAENLNGKEEEHRMVRARTPSGDPDDDDEEEEDV